MLKIWAKIFYRNSKKNWLNIVINVLGLTLGFAGLLIVLLYLNDEQNYNIYNSNKKDVFRVVHKMSHGEVWSTSTTAEGNIYIEEIPEVKDCYLSDSWYESTLIKINEKKVFTDHLLQGSSNFFNFFDFEIIEGSVDEFKKARNHIALSENQAKILFNKKSGVGKTISFLNRDFLVTTVYKIKGKHFFMPKIVFQYERPPRADWGNFSSSLFIKLVNDADVASVTKKADDVWYKYSVLPNAKADGITPELFEEKHGTKVHLEQLENIRLHTISDDGGPEGKGNYKLILSFLTLSVLLIIISSVNFINLSIASSTQRAKEVGVKKTLGLSKTTLLFQYSSEVLFQGILSFIFSLVLVELILPSFNSFMYKKITLFNFNVLCKLLLIVLCISLLIGSIAAIYVTKFRAIDVLKGNISRSKQSVLARNIMLGFQFIISGFFITGSVIIGKQVNYMMNKDLGFNGDQVLMVSMNSYGDRYKKYLLAKEQLIKHPNITAVTSNSFIIGGGSANSTNVNHKDISIQSNSNAIDFNYLDVMEIPILKGRVIKEKIASDTIKNILINETLAKSLNLYNDPIGKIINLGFGSEDNDGKNMHVIGMVKDHHTLGLDNKIPPTFYTHWNSFDWMKLNFWRIQLKIKPNNVKETLNYIEKYWKNNIEQDYPFSASFVNKRFARTYKKYQKQQTLFLILTTVVIIISLLGLFALATLTIQQRLKEVAIRKTLGASVKEIMYLLIKTFVKIVLFASVILIPLAYYFIQDWLNNFAYRIEMPLLPYVLTPITLTLLVFLVVGYKAYKASKIDLIKYLKFE
ncbi:ABC transporter permease [Tenacibaculum sp. M341]|uniref:ABC transporter permease n=1 Tax=Tenacibaculum sp. M341 TaxID=2530339 RepID=UPI00104CBB93|nr:ABC transporter permease [Tenacibaculum sp. M341]TCI91008.1 ABC transporter permease [Tenacibaculum sp. M341]